MTEQNFPDTENDVPDDHVAEFPITLSSTEQDRDGFYHRLRAKIHKWAESKTGRDSKWLDVILVAPDFFHLLCKLITDPRVPASQKAKAGAIIAYYISPLDFMPEAIMGPFGFADDVALAAWFINQLINKIDPAIVRRHWAGPENMLAQVHHISEVGDEMLGGGMFKRVIDWFHERGK